MRLQTTRWRRPREAVQRGSSTACSSVPTLDHLATLHQLPRQIRAAETVEPQRVGGHLLRWETKTESSDARLPVEPRNFHRNFKARCAKAGVRPISVHATRRTCASLLVARDVHPRVAMQVLRHSQIALTMNVYSQVSSTESRTALRRLGEQLQGG